MNSVLRVTLNPAPEQSARLEALQEAFAKACNSIAPLVQASRVWNRVALHHLAYRGLRQAFPNIGSQMACNVIYSVSRACRIVYQHPDSPFNLQRLGDKPLPLVQFDKSSPVYFDRHTLSLRDGTLSMYTLDGRMRFQVALTPQDEERFRNEKVREIVLARPLGQGRSFELAFHFSQEGEVAAPIPAPSAALPVYLRVESAA
ncbi:hypothetical protein [Ramlibacter sp. PS4R-6]|uniref:hypothetical protein n=1 Tax=Ramlibacter sp. PS4R-6 TaxID=3133438 RepID=UPI0030B1BA62